MKRFSRAARATARRLATQLSLLARRNRHSVSVSASLISPPSAAASPLSGTGAHPRYNLWPPPSIHTTNLSDLDRQFLMTPTTMSSFVAALALLVLVLPSHSQLIVMNAEKPANNTRRAGAEVGAGRAVDVCPASFPHGLALSCRRTGQASQPAVTLHFRCSDTPPVGSSEASMSASGVHHGGHNALVHKEGATPGGQAHSPGGAHHAPSHAHASGAHAFGAPGHATAHSAGVPHHGTPDVPPCAVVPASGHIGGLPDGWVPSPEGSLTFRPLDNSTKIFLPNSSGALVFAFGVPRKARYAFVLDMTTRAPWSHNDVWWQLLSGGGFLLRRAGRSLKASRGFVKAYHNGHGRAAHSVSIDSDGHALSSKEVLVPGMPYYFALAGRSTQLTVHRAVMFPCEGVGCETTSKHWQNMVSRCK